MEELIMEKIAVASRYILGLIFFVFGLNGFLQFLPMPAMNPEATSFMMALMGSGYLMIVVNVVKLLTGALLLSGKFVPLAVILQGPVVVNIALFHIKLAPEAGLPMAIGILIMWFILIKDNMPSYDKIFKA
jgi:putative oxidoreductase